MPLTPPASPASHPLRRLFAFAGPYRRNAILAACFSVLNKFFDVLPELLIGVAVDVVVNKKDSFLARSGIAEPTTQLIVLVSITALVWGNDGIYYSVFNGEGLDAVWRMDLDGKNPKQIAQGTLQRIVGTR